MNIPTVPTKGRPADFTAEVDGVIGPLIPTLARAHRAMSQELLRGTGLSAGQELLVMRLFDQPAQSQASLTRWLGVEPPTTAKMLARMEKAGFVERTRSVTDRRVTLVTLTSAGRALHRRVSTVWEDLEKVTTANLTDAEIQELERLLRRLIANLHTDREAPTEEECSGS
ncbi:MarR family winged helix-turn-helix transcriptional regulator [Arthrobacter sp. FW306-2-2C-D06B]|uniref:MarR family winged helix-turn-helix transcriptional regulator n=1 Tax=Arthrobacter sp. FW306-2-2C-D06B TaxID=2879618 RepID=UPI001F36BC68|nr:MarR family winged helix-turn-helix transcriptional regulator [Arthrobacter sp. FW306-2-2C-D06B]UKA59295.1 MarR family winged helix-turn-helix transcriptional regulator [Arthrobacter sp. FW306-2-2C-D06B]